jgi:hypothetical protein
MSSEVKGQVHLNHGDSLQWEEKWMVMGGEIPHQGQTQVGIKLILLGQKIMLMANKDLVLGDNINPKDNKKIEIRETKELAYSNIVVLWIDTSTSAGHVAFNIMKCSKTRHYPNINADVAWQGLQKKFALTTSQALTGLSKILYGTKLYKRVDP